jgi:hypothetical protein
MIQTTEDFEKLLNFIVCLQIIYVRLMKIGVFSKSSTIDQLINFFENKFFVSLEETFSFS